MDSANENRTGEEYAFEVTAPKDLATQFAELRAQVTKQEEELEQLRKQVRAKGTRDFPPRVAEEVLQPKPRTLTEEIEAQLRAHILSTDELAKVTGRSREEVQAVLKAQRPKLHNLGTPERARWSWRVGNEAAPPELRSLVERLISFAPMEFRDLVAATGAREGLIQGHLVEIRKVKPVVDLGTPGRARWFLMPSTARDATLQRRR